MEKRDFIQTCLNNRLLEANLPCTARPAGCAPHVMGLELTLGSLQEQSPFRKPKARVPQGDPKNRTEGAEESVHIYKGAIWGRSPSSVCKAFTKTPTIICLILAPRLLWAEYLCLQAAHTGAKKQNHRVTASFPNYPGTKLMAQVN